MTFAQQDTTFIAALNAIRFGRCPPEVRPSLEPRKRRQLRLSPLSHGPSLSHVLSP